MSFLPIDLLHACDNFVIGLFPVFRPIIGLLLRPLPQAIPVCCTAVWAKEVPNWAYFIMYLLQCNTRVLFFKVIFFWGWDQFKNFACWTGRLKKNFLLAPFANSLFHSAHCTGANNYVCAWSSLKSIEGLLLSLGIFHD